MLMVSLGFTVVDDAMNDIMWKYCVPVATPEH